MWCENGGGTSCGSDAGNSTVDNDDDDDDNILIIAGKTNLDNNSVLQASIHKSSMLAHKVN